MAEESKGVSKCISCKKEVARTAKVCPHCGQKNPETTMRDSIVGCLGFVVIVMIITIIVGWCGDGQNDRNTQKEPETSTAKQAEHTALHEILNKFYSERGLYNDPDSFVFSGWENKPIKLTGLVKDIIPDGAAATVYFHDGGGEKELVGGDWKWTGWNRGVYARFNNKAALEMVKSDDFLTMVCEGVAPQTDKDTGTFFGIELQNCDRFLE